MNTLRTGILLAAMTALFMGVGYLLGGGAGMAIALLVAAGTNMFAYWNSDKMVLKMYGAQEVDENHASGAVRRYGETTRELARTAGLPLPKIYVNQNDQPNAFA